MKAALLKPSSCLMVPLRRGQSLCGYGSVIWSYTQNQGRDGWDGHKTGDGRTGLEVHAAAVELLAHHSDLRGQLPSTRPEAVANTPSTRCIRTEQPAKEMRKENRESSRDDLLLVGLDVANLTTIGALALGRLGLPPTSSRGGCFAVGRHNRASRRPCSECRLGFIALLATGFVLLEASQGFFDAACSQYKVL